MHDLNPQISLMLDARQQACPAPILMLKRAIKTLQSGQVILLKATDPHSQQDLAAFCRVQQLHLRSTQTVEKEYWFYIEK